MKLKITESQFDMITDDELNKKTLFKIWGKIGPKIDNYNFQIFGINKSYGPQIKISDIRRYLREYLGKEKVNEILNDLFSIKVHKIDKCGGYNFKFIPNYSIDDNMIMLDVIVDDEDGKVDLIITGGGEHKIKDVRKEEFGWEIEGEVEDCLTDYFSEKLENVTGLDFVFNKIKYKSDYL
jgi:hypothetical protein